MSPDVLHDTLPLHEFQAASIRKKFIERFGTEPLVVRSPGRINLIGEHTDYNDGFVMPAAIDREIVIAIGLSDTPQSTLYSIKHDETLVVDASQPDRLPAGAWGNYLLGVVRKVLDSGYKVKPFHCVVGGSVPTGAGLSSSAALECGFAYALDSLLKLGIPRIDLIHMAQWAEHNYAGVKCGIMDQFASMMGQEGKAFVLDCRSLEYRYFPVDLNDYRLVLCDTLVKHSLASTEYNTRRAECEQGVAILKKHYPNINSLRDASPAMIEQHKAEFPAKVYDRCAYVTAENERVLAAANDLAAGNLEAFGKRMFETHQGLSKQYEVSCLELDFLVDVARNFDGVLGARMMGGGFGGCTLNLVRKDRVDAFIEATRHAYMRDLKRETVAYVVAVKDGTSVIPASAFVNQSAL